MKILLLGQKGMLGHMVHKFLISKGVEVQTIDNRWPSNGFKQSVIEFDGDFIVNCIGAIHQKTQVFDVNWELPIFLDLYSKARIIHPGTDCEIDEDNYGRSKRIAREFIVASSKNTKSLKTSIIGPELNGSVSLMDWFLSNKDGEKATGYTSCYWNGNTTLTWAEFALEMICDWDRFGKETIISSDCISKKEILECLNSVFGRKIEVIPDDKIKIQKCLSGHIVTPHIQDQLQKLKKFYYDKN